MKGKSLLCKCGCGEKVTRSKLSPYNWNIFILSHNCRGKTYMKELKKYNANNPPPLCKCGCGEKVTRRITGPHNWNVYINGHCCRGKNFSEDYRRKISEGLRKSHAERNHKKHTEKSYGFGFNKILKKEIKDRDNHICQICWTKESDLDLQLVIHHIDYDKKNNDDTNLISLCPSCHGKTNAIRAGWRIFFKKRIEVIYKKIVA